MPYLILCCIYPICNLKMKKCDQCCCKYLISIVTLCIFSLCCIFTKQSQKTAVNGSQPGVMPTGSFLLAICLQIQLMHQPGQNSKNSGKVSTDCDTVQQYCVRMNYQLNIFLSKTRIDIISLKSCAHTRVNIYCMCQRNQDTSALHLLLCQYLPLSLSFRCLAVLEVTECMSSTDTNRDTVKGITVELHHCLRAPRHFIWLTVLLLYSYRQRLSVKCHHQMNHRFIWGLLFYRSQPAPG